MRLWACLMMAAACATPYGPSSILGGYEDLRLAPGTYEIHVSGNRHTSQLALKGYFRRRAAELCPRGYTIASEGVQADKDTTVFDKSSTSIVTTYRWFGVVRCEGDNAK